MNFFERQEQRKKNTWILLGIFFVLLFLLNFSLYSVVFFLLSSVEKFLKKPGFQQFWNPTLFFWVTTIFSAFVLGGFLWMKKNLSEGGPSVALLLGGDLLLENPDEPDEKKVLNVVEEMALASGLPVPLVFVLRKEMGINAFAAGYEPSDAVIGITQGALNVFTRDEMQAVVAHEFSHILHGDMRLNLQMICLLNGLMMVGTLGSYLQKILFVRFGIWGVWSFVLGWALTILGFLGNFFGRILQRSISRQREYLADAAAIQFTRNPGSVVRALKKIGGARKKGQIKHHFAKTLNHIFYTQALPFNWFGWMDTHPPLVERIRAIDPNFNGIFPRICLPDDSLPKKEPRAPLDFRIPVVSPLHELDFKEQRVSSLPENLIFASTFLAQLSENLLQKARDPKKAPALVYALLFLRQKEKKEEWLSRVKDKLGETWFQEVLSLNEELHPMDPNVHLPFLDLCVSSLRRLSLLDRSSFLETIRWIIRWDGRIDLFEFSVLKILSKALEAPSLKKISSPQFFSIQPLIPDCEVVLSVLAYAGHPTFEKAKEAFSRVGHELTRGGLGMLPLENCSLPAFEKSLERISLSVPNFKKKFLEATMICISADGRICLKERELLRGICEVLECPLPSFLDVYKSLEFSR